MVYSPRRSSRSRKSLEDERKKRLIGAEILSYVKYLIYSAAFTDPTAEPRGSIHAEFYRGWSRTFHTSEDLICRKMRSSWSAGMPTSAEQQACLTLGR